MSNFSIGDRVIINSNYKTPNLDLFYSVGEHCDVVEISNDGKLLRLRPSNKEGSRMVHVCHVDLIEKLEKCPKYNHYNQKVSIPKGYGSW